MCLPGRHPTHRVAGSRVYGTANEQSDWDFMAIVTHTVFLPDDGEHYLWECYDDGTCPRPEPSSHGQTTHGRRRRSR